MLDSTTSSSALIRRFPMVSSLTLAGLLLFWCNPAQSVCEGDWLVDPDATGEEGQTFLQNFHSLLGTLTHVSQGPQDQAAVDRVLLEGETLITAPWFKSSAKCTEEELKDRIVDDEVLIADPSLYEGADHYLMVTDELSELAWVVSLGTDEPLMKGIDRTVRAMGSNEYLGLPCWVVEVREDVSPARIICVSEDTATDGTVRLGLAYYNAANNPHFSETAREYFRQRGDAFAARHLEVEYLHETHTSGVTGQTMDHWVAGGGNAAQSLAGLEMFIGYHQDAALFLLAAYVSTGDTTYLDRAEDVVDQWLTASSFDGTGVSFGAKKFRWVLDAAGELQPEAIEAWEVSDAPRALWMGHVLRAYLLATDGAPLTAPYTSLSNWVQMLLATDTQTATHSCIEYNPDGTAKPGNCGDNYYYHGLSMGLLTFHNLSWLETKLLDTLGKYSWDPNDGLYWDFTECFGIYRPVRPLKALASAIGLDASTYGGRRPKACFLDVARTGTGTGFVLSDRTGIDCGTDCSGLFVEDEQVTLNPDAYEGSTFSGWSEMACSGGSVSLNGDTVCTAQFDDSCDPLVDLQAQTVTGTETFAGCEELRAGNGFQISGGDVTLRAGGRIVLYDGFSVVSGGSLSAQAGAEP